MFGSVHAFMHPSSEMTRVLFSEFTQEIHVDYENVGEGDSKTWIRLINKPEMNNEKRFEGCLSFLISKNSIKFFCSVANHRRLPGDYVRFNEFYLCLVDTDPYQMLFFLSSLSSIPQANKTIQSIFSRKESYLKK